MALSAAACVVYTNPPQARQPAAPAAAAPAAPAAAPAATAARPAATPAQPAKPGAAPFVIGHAGPPAATATPAPVATVAPTAPKSISVGGKPVPVVTGNNAFGGGDATGGALQGLVYFIPENSQKFPDLTGMTPTTAMYSKSLNVEPRDFKEGFPGVDNRVEWFAIRWTGSFTTSAAAGEYDFRVLSDDGALVRIDNVLVIDNDGVHAAQDKHGKVKLTPGTHSIQVDYFQGPKWQIALQLWVTPPGAAEKLWSPAL